MPTDQLNNRTILRERATYNKRPWALVAIGCFVFAFVRVNEAARRADT